MDYSHTTPLSRPAAENQVPLGGHIIHKDSDAIRSVANDSFQAPSGGHVLHNDNDAIINSTSFSNPSAATLPSSSFDSSSSSFPSSSMPADSSFPSSTVSGFPSSMPASSSIQADASLPREGDTYPASSSSFPASSSSFPASSSSMEPTSYPAPVAFTIPIDNNNSSSLSSNPFPSSTSSNLNQDFSGSSLPASSSSFNNQDYNAMPSSLSSSSYSQQPPSSHVLRKGEDIVRTTDNIEQDVSQAGLVRANPAVRDTQDAAQNLMWELEREKDRKYQEDILQRQRALLIAPTDQAIRRTDEVIEKADQIKKEAKAEGISNINPAVTETKDAAKALKKELQAERKDLEPHKEGLLERAKDWIAGDSTSTSARSYDDADRSTMHTKDDFKHHDALVKEINKRDTVGEEKVGFMDKAKGWFGGDKRDERAPVVEEYQQARMEHPDLVVKGHDDVVDDIANNKHKLHSHHEDKEGGFMDKAKGWFGGDKRDERAPVVDEYQQARMEHPDLVVKGHDDVVDDIANNKGKVHGEGLIAKVKHMFKGSSDSDNLKDKPAVAAPTHPVHEFQDYPTTEGVLPASNATSFPQGTQTVFLPEQRSNLPVYSSGESNLQGGGLQGSPSLLNKEQLGAPQYDSGSLQQQQHPLLGSSYGSSLGPQQSQQQQQQQFNPSTSSISSQVQNIPSSSDSVGNPGSRQTML